MSTPSGAKNDRQSHPIQKYYTGRVEILLLALAVCAFLLAILISYLASRHHPGDLRVPAVLLINALAGMSAALVYNHTEGLLTKDVFRWCVAFGLWAAAVFYLVPPFMEETALFNIEEVSIGFVLRIVPFLIVIRGFVLIALFYPYTYRIFIKNSRPFFDTEPGMNEVQKLNIGTVAAFYLIAAVVRIFATWVLRIF